MFFEIPAGFGYCSAEFSVSRTGHGIINADDRYSRVEYKFEQRVLFDDVRDLVVRYVFNRFTILSDFLLLEKERIYTLVVQLRFRRFSV